jgi:hypothetical protein
MTNVDLMLSMLYILENVKLICFSIGFFRRESRESLKKTRVKRKCRSFERKNENFSENMRRWAFNVVESFSQKNMK